MSCQVLRCQEARDHVLEMNLPGQMLMQAAVCDAHKQRMDAGDPWYYSADENAIYMGSDLEPAGVRRVSAWSLVVSKDRLSSIDGPPVRMKITHTNIVGSDAQDLVVVVTDDDVAGIRRALSIVTE